jgi:uncharacterized membrane protein
MHVITVDGLCAILGAFFALVAIKVTRESVRRWRAGAFWGLLAVVYLFGKMIPPLLSGYLLLGMVVLAAMGRDTASLRRTTSKSERQKEATRLRNRLFWPVLLVPAVTVTGSLLLDKLRWGGVSLIDPKETTLASLGVGAVLALALALRNTGAKFVAAGDEGVRLIDTLGWTLILPQLLAALGGIFAASGVGEVITGIVSRTLPSGLPFVAVAVYCLAMMLFTICMGNAFAAFAVITGGIGVPLIVQAHGGNPAIMGAVGMLSGYCGTLLTPMAANFNLVPALLLELRDKYAVIRAQAPIAAVVFVFNVLLMYLTVYRF